MTPNRSHPAYSKSYVRASSVSPIELQERMKETLRELYDLIEQYAPPWYPRQLHKKAESVLQLFEK
jgi:hypothetical protein